ncbi:polycystic kidney disease 1-like 2 [Cichlidogyrus casuarinus]|uniref:Polycystic kidney disease 1-like 2 n=1 Tax=Cichlidogyrus casuarinus TaxID=1844966 RepID=A0ABD2Q5C7_9PLAT
MQLVTGQVANFCTQSFVMIQGEIKLCMSVVDSLGQEVISCFRTFSMQEPAAETLTSQINNLASNPTVLQDLINSGASDTQNTPKTLISLASAIKGTQEVNNTANATDLQGERNTRASVLGLLMEAGKNLVPTDSSSAITKVSVLSSLAAAAADMDKRAQADLGNELTVLTKNLEQLSKKATVSQVQSLGQELVKTALSFSVNSNKQTNDPVPADIPKSPSDIVYNTDLTSQAIPKDMDPSVYQSHKNQQAVAKSNSKVVDNVFTAVRSMVGSVLVPGGPPFRINSEFGNLTLEKISRSGTKNNNDPRSKMEFGVTGTPDLCKELAALGDCADTTNYDFTLQRTSSETNTRSFGSSASVPVPITSGTISMNVYMNKKNVKVAHTSKPFIINIPQSQPTNFAPIDGNREGKNPQLPPVRVAVDGTEIYTPFLLTANMLRVDNSALTFELRPSNVSQASCPKYLVVNSFIDPPNIGWGGSIDTVSHWTVLPTTDQACTLDTRYTGLNPWAMFINNSLFVQLKKTAITKAGRALTKTEKGMIYFGYREIADQEYQAYRNGSGIQVPYPYRDQVKTYTEVRSYVSSCVYYNATSNSWLQDGCNVSPWTTAERVVCECNHLTSFSSGWITVPNTINFDYAFKNMDFSKHATLYATEIALAILFLLLALWARWKDKRDIAQLGLTILAENEIDDEYLYEIFVSTGKRDNSGTESTVYLRLCGENGETVALRLKDPQRKLLQRSSLDRFLLAVPRPLGQLKFIRLWHNNAGEGDKASWYCNYVTITDLQNKRRTQFIVNRWFAVEKDDGLIDRVMPVSGPMDVLQFQNLFGKTFTTNLSEGHLWISVFARPAHSRFTRLERVGCCVLLIYLTMLTACMFYRTEGPVIQQNIFSIGPFSLSTQELFNAVISNLITFVPLFVVVEIFRRSRLRSNHSKKLIEAIEKQFNEPFHVDLSRNSRDALGSNHGQNLVSEEEGENSIKIARRLLPWQMRILAWIIIFLTLATSVFFVTFYGISFGDTACGKWLSTLTISFLVGIFVIQPLKVFALAVFVSLVCPSMDRAEEIEFLDEEELIMNQLQSRYLASVLHLQETRMQYLVDGVKKTPFSGYQNSSIMPPDPDTLARAKEIRLMHIKMHEILRELAIYLLFFICLIIVTSSFRGPNAYYVKNALSNTFFGANDFEAIITENDMWQWLKTAVVSNLQAGRWYNDYPPLELRGFLSDRVSRMIGYARLRQLRVTSRDCDQEFTFSTKRNSSIACYGAYSFSSQDERDFAYGWTMPNANNSAHPWFSYNDASKLGGYPYLGVVDLYSGGGYPVNLVGTTNDLNNTINALQESHWVDAATRAIFLEFTIYNPNVNMFANMLGLIEFPAVGGAITYSRVEPFFLRSYLASDVKMFELVTQALFAVLLVFYFAKELRRLVLQRLAYFSDPWTYCELFIIIGSFAAIGCYVTLVNLLQTKSDEFRVTNGDEFSNFQLVAFWNEQMGYLTSLLAFAATLKFISVLQFIPKINLLGTVLSLAARDLKYFILSFAIVFAGFVMVFYMLFMNHLEGYNTILGTIESSFQIMLGHSDFSVMRSVEPILAPLFFSCYSVCVVFIMVAVFIVIIEDNLDKLKKEYKNPNRMKSEFLMVSFMTAKFLHWTNLPNTRLGRAIISDEQWHYYRSMLDASIGDYYDDDADKACAKKLDRLSQTMDNFLAYVKRTQISDKADEGKMFLDTIMSHKNQGGINPKD